jgi:predicted nucleic acid-binding protein
MSFFIDTGVWYAQHDQDAPRHKAADTALRRALSGELGGLFTSGHILDEAVTLTRSRTTEFRGVHRLATRILGSPGQPAPVNLLVADLDHLTAALGVLDRYQDQPLSFTDASTIAFMREHAIDRLLSFDSDFDGIVTRVEPNAL